MLTIHVWPRWVKEFLLTHPLYKSPNQFLGPRRHRITTPIFAHALAIIPKQETKELRHAAYLGNRSFRLRL